MITVDLTSPPVIPPCQQAVHEKLTAVLATADASFLRRLRQKSPQDVLNLARDLDRQQQSWREKIHQEHARLVATVPLEEDEFFAYLINRLLAACPSYYGPLRQLVQEVGWESLFILSTIQRRYLRSIHDLVGAISPESARATVQQFRYDLARSPMHHASDQLWAARHEAALVHGHLQELEAQGLLPASRPLRKSA